MNNILTFDIEDNFTHAELCNPHDWDKYEGQIVGNTQSILDLIQRHGATATFFVLGKVAERRPEIVSMIAERQHEVASHGHIHERVLQLGKEGFEDDAVKSKAILESLSGQSVRGYRAMAFSIDVETAWALDCLAKHGFSYDSSIPCSYYRKQSRLLNPHLRSPFSEVPVSSVNIFGHCLTIGGGTFFRCAPYSLIEKIIKKENSKGRSVMLYAHAWEFNKDQPKRKVNLAQSLAQSPATFTTAKRLDRLLGDFSFTSIENLLGETS